MTTTTTAQVTTLPIGSGRTELVFLAGREIGSVIANDSFALASITGRSYKFATREDAITACISYARRGYWENEIS